jgi:hypothetical protein
VIPVERAAQKRYPGFVRGIVVIACLLAACGRIGFGENTTGDDAPPDGPPPPGPISLTILDNGTPLEDIEVLFQDPSGAFVEAKKTDANGKVTAVVAANSMLTIVHLKTETITSMYELRTIGGLQPGDDIVLGNTTDPDEPVGEVAAALPGAFAGATVYTVRHGCTSESLLAGTDVSTKMHLRRCARNNRGAVFALAHDDGNALAYSFVTDIALSTTATAQITLPAWVSTWDGYQITVTNPPAGTSNIGMETAELWDGVAYDNSGANTSVLTPPIVKTVNRATAFANGFELIVAAGVDDGATGIYRRGPSQGTSTTVDLSTALPSPTKATLTSDPSGRARMRATVGGSLANVDATFLDVSWVDGTGEVGVYWAFTLPPGVTELQLPELSSKYAVLATSSTTTFEVPRLSYIDLDYVTGYAPIRTRPFDFDEAIDAPASTTIRFAFANANPFGGN